MPRKHPQADVAVDAVIFRLDLEAQALRVLLVERATTPYKGSWALPGGYIRIDESLEDSVHRVLEAKTSMTLTYLEQLYTFGEPTRDPRGRVISVAYFGLVRPQDFDPHGGGNVKDARWFSIDWQWEFLPMAFDHQRIIKMALERLRSKVRWQPVGFGLLPERFSMGQLQQVYEILLGRPVDKRNLSSTIKRYGLLLDTGEREDPKIVRHRPAQLYRFNSDRYRELQVLGVDFEV